MKTKILLSFAILFFAAITTNAQITKGKYLLGVGAGYYNSGGDNNNSVNVSLQFGKVIKENTVVGVIGSISGNKTHSGNDVYHIYNYIAGVFFRKYKPLGKKFYFFQQIDLAFQHSHGYQTYFSNAGQSLFTNSNGIVLNYIPGISYAVSKRMQIELAMLTLASVSYAHVKTIDSQLPSGISPQEANNFSANINLNSNFLNNLGIGFKFLLGK